MKYEPIIGLEVHMQVKTKSKMFSSVSADYFGHVPNTHVTPVEFGLPGALPVPNKVAIEKCIKLALALNCSINKKSKFDRKNYYYPDLPKGYQISQFDLPFGYEGFIEIDVEGDARRIRLTRIHLEEDTGKSMHEGNATLVDYNKAGMPLIEIVTEPDFIDDKEVEVFAKRLRQIVRYLGISDADMEKGQMRFELNMSVREIGQKGLPDYKVEIKNIGSISVLQKVIASEFVRQTKLLEKGETPKQETRGLKDMSGETVSQRIKEDSDDYRYFPEPDIPPIIFTDEEIDSIRSTIGELPAEKKQRFIEDYMLEPSAAETLVATRRKAEWFETAIKDIDNNKLIAEVAKWYVGDVIGLIKADKSSLAKLKFKPADLVELVRLVDSGKLSGTLGKQVLVKMYKTGDKAKSIVEKEGLEVVSDSAEIEVIADKVIADNPKVVADIDKNPNAIKFLLGKIMQETKGKADPNAARVILETKLVK